jgi:hypothetical protein
MATRPLREPVCGLWRRETPRARTVSWSTSDASRSRKDQKMNIPAFVPFLLLCVAVLLVGVTQAPSAVGWVVMLLAVLALITTFVH